MSKTIKTMITGYIPDVWPIVIIITVIACSLRITYLIKNHQKFCFYKELFMLIFILYVMCLFEVVTMQDDNYGLSNFIPFHEIFRYKVGSRLFIKNILGNIILFLPYGYFTADYLKEKKVSLIASLTLILSVTIEIVQLHIGRTFDIDDCILNMCGGILGCFIYVIIDNIHNNLPKVFKTEGFINFLVILLSIIGIIYLFDLNILEWFIG